MNGLVVNSRTIVHRSMVMAALLSSCLLVAQNKNQNTSPIIVQPDGKLSYTPDALGNRVPDFSYAGYGAGEKTIPHVPARVVVPLQPGDATARIQSAINYVSSLTPGRDGFRGAVLLLKGTYRLEGQLKIHTSGVVLRGSGIQQTILSGEGKSRETLIQVAGIEDKILSSPVTVIDHYVPVNALQLTVQSPGNFKAGDRVIIHRPSTQKWIQTLGTDHFGGGITALGWKPGERDLYFDRRVVSITGNRLLLDAPLTTALDTTYGKSTVTAYTWPGWISHTGIENLSCQSTYNIANSKDEEHRWMAITMEHVEDAWVRQVEFYHFAGSAVYLSETTKRITVEDCLSLAPVSEIGGQRRYTFFTNGQQTLFQRCYAEKGYHDFAVGFCAPGPNAFVQCQSVQPYQFSGTIDSWASGVLFDNVVVDGNAIRLGNRGQDGQGAGWSAANSVLWQCSAARIDCYRPPTAQNWAFGTWAQFSGDGYWESSNEHIKPRSLYFAQLASRLGDTVMRRSFLLPMDSEASSSPPVSVAMELSRKTKEPVVLLMNWIRAAASRQPIPTDPKGLLSTDKIPAVPEKPVSLQPSMKVKNGWLVRGDHVLTGKRSDVQWWSGGILPADLPKMKPHLTRFVPGRTGWGLTDDLRMVTQWMKSNGVLAIEHNYGLWYDRRRDDHERVRRMDGEVWPPFYELPFARSGKDTAWDGLSKYDLTQYNSWYWDRLKRFADLADKEGLALVHQQYFQHNIIEAGAHYTDFPWRTANNINGTGFPEPVPYAGDKRIFMAEQFYDVNDPARRKIHIAYIRKCLDNFKNNTGVIQMTSAEYTGPLHFVQFWLEVVSQWKTQNNSSQIIGLSTTKDVQDAILADKTRSKAIDLIDIRYWHYQEDGVTYEPKGGQNLAPRQHARLLKPERTSFEQVYRAVSEYRKKFPEKAVTYSGDNYDQFGWAVFMAGGSMAVLPELPAGLLADASSMKPAQQASKAQWVLSNDRGVIVYSMSGEVKLQLPNGSYTVSWIDPKTGKTVKSNTEAQGGKAHEFSFSQTAPLVLWIRHKMI